MPNIFEPPIAGELPRTYVGGRNDPVYPVSIPGERLGRYLRRGGYGMTIFKYKDGSYQEVLTPTQDEAQAPEIDTVYWGGSRYSVDDQEAAALRAAGFDVEIV